MDKYRAIKRTYNWYTDEQAEFIIEKRRRFLFWTWWSDSYLIFYPDRYYSGKTAESVINRCDILNKKKEEYTIEVLN